MSDHTIPVLPVTHPAGHYNGHSDGFDPSDAALVQATNLAVLQQSQKDSQCESVKAGFAAERSTLVSRFEVERAMKDLAVRQEALERENQNVMRNEFAALKVSMAEAETRRQVERLADRRFDGIESVLKEIIGRLPATP